MCSRFYSTIAVLFCTVILLSLSVKGFSAGIYHSPPGADFSAQPTSGLAPLAVTFTDLSSGVPTSWLWKFGDGDSSVVQNPVHTYLSAGTYTVILTASNADGNGVKTKNGYIQVNQVPDAIPVLDFDSIADFSLTFNPWTVNDVGGGATWGINQVTFPHSGEAMAFICFNPSMTTPPLTNMIPHSGKKLGACFSSMSPHNPNNKWLISPLIHILAGERIGLWVETYNKDYGLEIYNVGVSTTGNNPSDFTVISGSKPDTAPIAWTYKEYDLANYVNQNVYIGIQCVSSDQFIFMIDDVRIGYPLGVDDKGHNVDVSVYPNPVSNRLFIDPGPANRIRSAELISNLGTIVRRISPAKDDIIISFDLTGIFSGIYFVRIVAGNKVILKKVIIENQ